MTIVIADDNALIRSWLKIILQQLEGNALHILEAVDGDDALSLCMEHAVDLLITDIKMPGMDGITLIKTLLAERPNMCAAVLSSYGDFDYVRVALKCGALDYILKAEMQQEDISALMEKVRESLALSNQQESHWVQYHEDIQKAQAAYHAYLRSHNAAPLLNLCMGSGASSGCITILVIRDHSASVQVSSICCNILKIEALTGIAFPLDSETFLMIYSMENSPMPQKEQHLRLLSSLDQALTTSQLGRLCYNVNITFQRNEDFSQKLHLSQQLIDYQIYYNVSSLPPNNSDGYENINRTLLENIQTMLNIQNYHRACTLMQTCIRDYHKLHTSPHHIRHTTTAAIQMMRSALTLHEHQTETYQQLDQLIQSVIAAPTAILFQNRIDEFCKFYLQCSNQIQKISSPPIIRAMEYCHEAYAHKLTLQDVATYVRLNKSYFSQIFHKEVGMPFSEYLELVRIQHARQYLRSNSYSIAEIAELVGFSNQNYFTKVFKKSTGLTPSQYRASLSGKNPDEI